MRQIGLWHTFDHSILIIMSTEWAKTALVQNPTDDLVEKLKLRTQPMWQLALELSALNKKLKHVENEINVLGEKKSSQKAVKSRDSIRQKISALERELETRKESKL